jgi:hypothetical protein
MRGLAKPVGQLSGGSTFFASHGGVNSTCSAANVWTSQSTLWQAGGDIASIDLHFPSTEQALHAELTVDSGLALPHLQIVSAVSSSAQVDEGINGWSFRAKDGFDYQSNVKVTLKLDIPEVSEPSMLLLSGRKQVGKAGWQCFVTAVLVKP